MTELFEQNSWCFNEPQYALQSGGQMYKIQNLLIVIHSIRPRR